LGPSWHHAHSPKIGYTSHTAEHYGFVWDSNDLSLEGEVQNVADPNDKIDRNPAWATFKTGNGNLDFTVIAVHITWGSQGVKPRKEEVKIMATVWERVQEATTNDDDIILMGDFNRNVSCESFDPLLSIEGIIRANEETGPTHVSSTSTYDQIFLSTEYTSEWTGDWRTIKFDEVYFGNDDKTAKLEASDHRPVSIRLRVPVVDDD